MATKELFIKDTDNKGKYLFIGQMGVNYYLVFQPDDEYDKLYVVTLSSDLYIECIEDISIPVGQIDISDAKIIGMRHDSYGQPYFIGIVYDGTDHNQFIISASKFEVEKKVNYAQITELIPNLIVKSYKRFDNHVYLVGNRQDTHEEVYIKFNQSNHQIEEEIVFYSDLGEVCIESIYISKEHEVIVCGCIDVFDGDVFEHRLPYINKFLK